MNILTVAVQDPKNPQLLGVGHGRHMCCRPPEPVQNAVEGGAKVELRFGVTFCHFFNDKMAVGQY